MKKIICLIIILLIAMSFGFSFNSELLSVELKLINPQTEQQVSITNDMGKPMFPLKFELYGKYSGGRIEKIDENIEWIISDKEIAQIDGSGYLFFLDKQGFLTVEAQYDNKKAIYYTNIKWKDTDKQFESLKIEGNKEYHSQGNEIEVWGKMKSGELIEINGKDIIFSSSDKNIAYVVNQKIYFTGKVGMCVITAKYKNLTESLSIEVSSDDLLEIPIIRAVKIKPEYPTSYDEIEFEVITNVDKRHIKNEQWQGKKRFYDEGIYLPVVRVVNDLDNFSDWYMVPLFVGGRGDMVSEEENVFSEGIVDKEILRKNIFINLLNNDEIEIMDIEKHWAEMDIIKAVKMGFVFPNDESKIYPNKFLNREEIAMIICKALGFKEVFDYSFEDLENSDYKGYVYALNQKGLMNGYNDGLFKPNRVVSRGEFAQIISRVLDYNYSQKYIYNGDIKDISNYWGRDAIEQIVSIGLMQGDKENKFYPENPIKKAECIVVIKRLLEKDPLIKGVIEWVD